MQETGRTGWPRLSTILLVLAIVTTTIATVGGSWILLRMSQQPAAVRIAEDAANPTPDGEPITVAIGRTPGGPSEWIAYAAAFAQLQKDLHRPVEVRYSLERSAVAEMIASGEVDVAMISVDTYLRLSDETTVTLIATPEVDGRFLDAAVAVVAADSPFASLDDLRGTRFVVTPGSLASEAYSTWLLAERHESPETFFGAVHANDAQDEDLLHVAEGKADVAFVRRSALVAWPHGTFRVIAESPEFGMPPLVAGPGVDPETVEDIRTSLESPNTSGAIPSNSALGGFGPVTDADYEFSRTLRALAVDSGRGVSRGATE